MRPTLLDGEPEDDARITVAVDGLEDKLFPYGRCATRFNAGWKIDHPKGGAVLGRYRSLENSVWQRTQSPVTLSFPFPFLPLSCSGILGGPAAPLSPSSSFPFLSQWFYFLFSRVCWSTSGPLPGGWWGGTGSTERGCSTQMLDRAVFPLFFCSKHLQKKKDGWPHGYGERFSGLLRLWENGLEA